MKQIHFILIIGMFFFIAACQAGAEQSAENQSESAIGQLQHNVYFYLNEDVTNEEREQFEEGLKELLSIEAIHKYEIGIPGATEAREVTDHSFGYTIFSWFLTLDDYDIYADHPIHLEFIDEFNHLWADVKVYDSEIIGETD